jgi:hypothetical protein
VSELIHHLLMGSFWKKLNMISWVSLEKQNMWVVACSSKRTIVRNVLNSGPERNFTEHPFQFLNILVQ